MNKLVVVEATQLHGSVHDSDHLLVRSLMGRTVLERTVERVCHANSEFDVVIATSAAAYDDDVAAICERNGLRFYRGASFDNLSLVAGAALSQRADLCVCVSAYHALLDPRLIDMTFAAHMQRGTDFVGNISPRTWPLGQDVQSVWVDLLQWLDQQAESVRVRDDFALHFVHRPERYRMHNLTWEGNLDLSRQHRWIADSEAGYTFVRAVWSELYDRAAPFSVEDVLDLLRRRRDIATLGAECWARSSQSAHPPLFMAQSA